MRPFVLFALFSLATSATAIPLTYSNIQYSTSAYAEAGTSSDGINSDSSPPTALPLFSSASVIEGNEFAFGDGIADDFFLAAASEASSSTGHAGAIGEAAFQAELTGNGLYRLLFDFGSLSDLQGGTAGALLSIALSVGATTLFDEIFTAAGSIERLFHLLPSDVGVLSINLISTADAIGGYAFNLASVDARAAAVLPLPGTLALLAPALVMALSRSRRLRQQGS